MSSAFFSRLVESVRYEDDEEFRALMGLYVARRTVAAGIICLCALVIYVIGQILILGKVPVWSYEEVSGPLPLGIGDKLVIAAVSTLLIATRLLRRPLPAAAGRVLVAMASVAVVVAMTLDDVASGNVSHSENYAALVVLAFVGVVPFPPFQALLASAVVIGSWYTSIVWFPAFLGFDAAAVGFGQVEFLTIVWVGGGGIAATLYSGRFREFQIQREVRKAEEDLRRRAEELERTTDQLARLQQLRSRFFAGISHEFRTPITLILGPATDALRRDGDQLTEDVVEALELISRSGSRLENLVDQLLDLSRLDEGRLPLRVGSHDVTDFCRMIFALFESLAKSRQIQFSLESTCSNCELYFDMEQMQKVLTNLLSNAFKFTPDGGSIGIQISECAGLVSECVDISVKDNGKGIPSKDLALVFDRFYQVKPDSMQSQSGSGIGLALAKELVDLHGGELLVASREGLGSEFTVRLPKGKAHFAAEDLIEDTSEAVRFNSDVIAALLESGPEDALPDQTTDALPTVLIVDDHPDMRRYMFSLLKARYRTIVATNGAEGLETARQTLPDLIISDMMMPELDGFSFCSAIKGDRTTAHIPFILLTARESHDDRLEGLGVGADDYIVKPFDAEELMARAENLIEIRRALLNMVPDRGRLVEPSDPDEPSAESVLLDRVRQSVEQHLGDTNFTVDLLADDVGLSRRQLERRLAKAIQFTPAGYIRLMRLKRAAQLLERKVGTVAEVAYKVGFNDPNYFSTLFKQAFQVRPSDYPTREDAEDRP